MVGEKVARLRKDGLSYEVVVSLGDADPVQVFHSYAEKHDDHYILMKRFRGDAGIQNLRPRSSGEMIAPRVFGVAHREDDVMARLNTEAKRYCMEKTREGIFSGWVVDDRRN